MSCYLRLSLCLRKETLIPKTSYSIKYFSAFSSTRHRISCNKNVINNSFLRLNNSNAVPKRDLSLESFPNIYSNISSSSVAKSFKELILETHDFTGLSWTFTIIAAAVVLKFFITFPCMVYQRYLVAKLELIEVELDGMSKSIKEKIEKRALKEMWTVKKMKSQFIREVLTQRKILQIKNNCHPFKTVILFLIQLPAWLLLTIAIRTIAIESYSGQSDYPVAARQFQVGGPFWCRNLSMPDPIYILPTTTFLALLTTTELSFLTKISDKVSAKRSRFLINIIPQFLRLFSVMFLVISALSPSGLSLFWASNSLIGLGQSLLLLSPKVRRFFRIPKVPSDYDKPYRESWNKFVEKFTKFFLRIK